MSAFTKTNDAVQAPTPVAERKFGVWTVLRVEGRRAPCACECSTIRWLSTEALAGGASGGCGCQRTNSVIITTSTIATIVRGRGRRGRAPGRAPAPSWRWPMTAAPVIEPTAAEVLEKIRAECRARVAAGDVERAKDSLFAALHPALHHAIAARAVGSR